MLKEAQEAAAAAEAAAPKASSGGGIVKPGGAAGALRAYAQKGSDGRSLRALVGTVEAIAGSIESTDPPKVTAHDRGGLATICQKGWLLKRARHFNVS